MKLTQKISFRLAITSVSIALLVSLIMSLATLAIDYQTEQQEYKKTLNSIVSAAENTTGKAIYTIDKEMAYQVTTGILKYPFIKSVVIFDEDNSIIAEAQKELSKAYLSHFLLNKLEDVEVSHTVRYLSIEGRLTIVSSSKVYFLSFLSRTINSLMTEFISTLILVFILFFVFTAWMTRPLSDITHRFSGIKPYQPDGSRISIPKVHEKDELGELVNTANGFIEAVEALQILQKNSKKHLTQSRDTLIQLIDSLPHMIYLRGDDDKFIVINQPFISMLNLPINDFKNITIPEVINHLDNKTKSKLFEEDDIIFRSEKQSVIPEVEWPVNSKQIKHLEVKKIALQYEGKPAVLSIATDITERKRSAARIQHLAFHDSLTDLPNRLLLQDRLGQAIKSCERAQKYGALLFIDLDNFKNINDSLGHSAGDAVLRELAIRLTDVIRSTDTVARIGGDEFVVCLPKLHEDADQATEQAEQKASAIRRQVLRPLYFSNRKLTVTASIGIALFPDADQSASDLLRNADTAMYQAKSKGKDTQIIFESAMTEAATQRLELENDLRLALEREEFYLVFQPQIDYQSGSIIGAEALIRWAHPVKGLIPPNHFIPILEATGLINHVGDWVLKAACKQLAKWLEDGVWNSSQVMGINVSPQQFNNPNFYESVKNTVERYNIPPRVLDLEITEGMVISQVEDTIVRMDDLRNLGISFSIDDFGTGYSSLYYLKTLPLDVLKIDQTFVRDISLDKNDAVIVETIIAMSKLMGMTPIAEGVETESQLKFLTEKGCHRFQGYYFSKPLTGTDFEQWVSKFSIPINTH